MQSNAELAGKGPEQRQLPTLRLRLNLLEHKLGLQLHQRGVLGRLNISSAAPRGLADKSLCLGQVVRNSPSGAQLYKRGAKPSGIVRVHTGALVSNGDPSKHSRPTVTAVLTQNTANGCT